jgi:hypothetical protein
LTSSSGIEGDFQIGPICVSTRPRPFKNRTTYSTGRNSQSVAVGDFNNDTVLDIVVAHSGNNSIGILFEYGNGTFGNQTIYSINSSPSSVAAGDFNNDTLLDIVVASFGDEKNIVYVLLNYGNGSFKNSWIYRTDALPFTMIVTDFNTDNRLDILVTNSYKRTLEILLGYGNGSFTNQMTYSMVVGDFNSDKKVNFAVANRGTDNLEIFLQTC